MPGKDATNAQQMSRRVTYNKLMLNAGEKPVTPVVASSNAAEATGASTTSNVSNVDEPTKAMISMTEF